MRRVLAALLSAVCVPVWAAGPNILSNTDHIVQDVVSAVSILGGAGITIDQTCPTGGQGFGPGSVCGQNPNAGFVAPASLFATYGTNGSITNYSPLSTTPSNNAPYGVLNQSSTGYTLADYEQASYATLEANGTLFNIAYCGIPATHDYPPVAMSNILPSNVGIVVVPVNSAGCGYQVGIEFSMMPGYKGFATTTPSGTTEAMSGVFAVLKSNHPTETWGDIKGRLRQTADGWTAGYAALHSSPFGFGYGNIDYDAANAVSTVYLQPPGVVFTPVGAFARVTIYPYLSTRRAKEVVYIGGTWPAASSLNEMTAAQIASAGGTKVIDDAGVTGIQTFTYAPAASGTATFTAITLDASGNGSRVESFTQQSITFVVGTACLQ